MGIWTEKEDRSDLADLVKTDTADEEDDQYMPIDKAFLMNTKKKPEAIQLSDDIGEGFETLVKMNILEVGIGLGFSYQLLTTDLEGMNFASSRANKINDSRFFRCLYKWVVKQCCQYQWEKFVEWEILTGKIPGLGYSQFIQDSWIYTQAFWLPEGDDWVDPYKDAQAAELYYKLGVMTFQQMCSARGLDHIAVLEQRRTEKALFNEYGLEEIQPAKLFETSTAPADAQVVQEVETTSTDGDEK
jgi:capsid protein